MAIKNLGETNLGNLTTARNAEQLITPITGGGAPATPHTILSATHSDTLAASILRGDLLVGNATPKLSRLPIGGAGTILRSDGTDAGWASLSTAGIIGGTIAATQVAYGSAANTIAGSANLTWDNTNERLGIGNSGLIASYGLDIARQSGEAAISLTSIADAAAPVFRFRRAKGTYGSLATPTSGQGMLSMLGMLWDGSAFQNSVQILAQADASAGAGSTPGRLIFLTTPAASTTLAEVMRITSAAQVGIGSNAPGARLQVNGAASGIAEIIRANATTPGDLTQWQNSSGTVLASVTGAGILDTNGHRVAAVTKTADYTLAATDEVVIANKATAITMTLPAATGSGQWYAISSIGAGACTIDANGSETINGSLTQIIYQYEAIQLVDYASGTWTII